MGIDSYIAKNSLQLLERLENRIALPKRKLPLCSIPWKDGKYGDRTGRSPQQESEPPGTILASKLGAAGTLWITGYPNREPFRPRCEESRQLFQTDPQFWPEQVHGKDGCLITFPTAAWPTIDYEEQWPFDFAQGKRVAVMRK
jgi:hypothetical protein